MNLDPIRRVLDALGVRYALIGGHALAARGYPRFTIDIDLLTTDRRVLERHVWAAVIEQGAVVDARRGDDDDPLAGVAHVQLPDGTDVDVIVGRWAWERQVVERATPVTVAPGVEIPVPTASDLILLKLAAGGFADLQDAAALLASGDRSRLVAAVEAGIDDVRPDVRGAWRHLLERTAEP
jgi:hypothetical protein